MNDIQAFVDSEYQDVTEWLGL